MLYCLYLRLLPVYMHCFCLQLNPWMYVPLIVILTTLLRRCNLQPSSLRISPRKEKETLWSRGFLKCCTQTVFPFLLDNAVQRGHGAKNKPEGTSILRKVFQLFTFLFLQWHRACCCCRTCPRSARDLMRVLCLLKET